MTEHCLEAANNGAPPHCFLSMGHFCRRKVYPKQDLHWCAHVHMSRVPGLSPRLIVATASCANAELDCSDVDMVIHEGFPPSLMDYCSTGPGTGWWLQKGKCGTCSPTRQLILQHLSLKHFVYLIKRICTTNAPVAEHQNQLLSGIRVLEDVNEVMHHQVQYLKTRSSLGKLYMKRKMCKLCDYNENA